MEESSSNAPPKRRTVRRVALVLLAVVVVALTVYAMVPGRIPMQEPYIDTSRHEVIGVFGASGTAGDGVLKAMLVDPGVEEIFVVTRRSTPRIEEGSDPARSK